MLLAPASGEDVAGQLAAVFQGTNELTAWAHALLNVVLYPLDPKPDWYDPLDAALQQAHAGTLTWVTTQAPAIASGVPQAYIDYANVFTVVAPHVQALVASAVAQPNGQPTVNQLHQLQQLLMALRGQAADSAAAVSTLQSQMSAFDAQLVGWRTTIGAATQAADATITTDRADVDALQSQIAALLEKLGASTADANNAAQGAGIAAVSLVLSVLTFTMMAAATGGAAIPVMAVAGGLISTSVGTTRATLSERDVDTDLAAITALQATLTAESQQIAALQGIVRTLQNLQQANGNAADTVTSLLPVWNSTIEQLDWLLELLQQPVVNLSLVSALANVGTAATTWAGITTAAGNVQASTVTPGAPIVLSNSSATTTADVSYRQLARPAAPPSPNLRIT